MFVNGLLRSVEIHLDWMAAAARWIMAEKLRSVLSQGDTFELFEVAKEILDQMPPLGNLGINLAWTGASGMLGNHDLGAAFVEVSDQGI